MTCSAGALVPDVLATSIPGDVAEHLVTPVARELTLTIASVLCFADVAISDDARRGLLEPVRVTVVDDLARYLRVSALNVIELHGLTKHQRDRVAFDLFRRFPVATSVDEAPMVQAAMLGAETRLDIDARNVHALWADIESLPDGTVGAELVRYYRDNGWKYPGTDHHQPLAFAAHDFHHVLGGYATTPTGELQLGAFMAGVAQRLDGQRSVPADLGAARGRQPGDTPGRPMPSTRGALHRARSRDADDRGLLRIDLGSVLDRRTVASRTSAPSSRSAPARSSAPASPSTGTPSPPTGSRSQSRSGGGRQAGGVTDRGGWGCRTGTPTIRPNHRPDVGSTWSCSSRCSRRSSGSSHCSPSPPRT